MSNPRLEIVGDDSAVIVQGDTRFELKGPGARAIVSAYRHCLSHDGTGQADAALYLWGLIDGLRYDVFNRADELAERTREHSRELDRLLGRRSP